MIRKSIRVQVPSNLRGERRDQIIDLQLSECACSWMKHSKSETENQSILPSGTQEGVISVLHTEIDRKMETPM
jgi:hypothetical protein